MQCEGSDVCSQPGQVPHSGKHSTSARIISCNLFFFRDLAYI